MLKDDSSVDISRMADKPVCYEYVPCQQSVCEPSPTASCQPSVSTSQLDLEEQFQSKENLGTSLTELLTGCKIHLIKDEEIISGDDLPENFWSCNFSDVVVGGDLWSQVDLWR